MVNSLFRSRGLPFLASSFRPNPNALIPGPPSFDPHPSSFTPTAHHCSASPMDRGLPALAGIRGAWRCSRERGVVSIVHALQLRNFGGSQGKRACRVGVGDKAVLDNEDLASSPAANSASPGHLRSARVYTSLHPPADPGGIPNRYSARWGGTSPTAETALWAGRHRRTTNPRRPRAAAAGGGLPARRASPRFLLVPHCNKCPS